MSGNAEEFMRSLGVPRYDELDGEESPAPPGAPSRATRPPAMLDDLDRLRRDAEDLQRRFSVPLASETQGRDGTGAVQVTVGSDGRVTNIEIDRSWRSSVGEHGLNAAVLQAVTDAGMRRLAAWSEAVGTEQRPSGHRTSASGAPPSAAAASFGQLDDAEGRRTVQEVLSLLEGIEAELDSLEQRARQRVQQQVVGRSPSHQVKVTVAGGQVVAVDIQRRLMQRTDERGLARELLSAFQAAYERSASLKLDDLLGDGRLGRLHALTRDPDTFLRRLGLDRRN